MARRMIQLCFLLLVVYFVDGKPESCSECSHDIKQLKNSLYALNSEGQRMMTAINELRQQAASTTEGRISLKQCSKNNLYSKTEQGILMECVIEKKRDDTVLHIQWNGNLKLSHKGSKTGSCRRWYFTLNGKECSKPETIDAVLYVGSGRTNYYRPGNVEGYCRGVPAGKVNVAWNVGVCPGFWGRTYDVGVCFTGYVSTSRIIVKEEIVQDAENNVG